MKLRCMFLRFNSSASSEVSGYHVFSVDDTRKISTPDQLTTQDIESLIITSQVLTPPPLKMSRSLFFFFKFLFKYNCCTRKVDHLFDYFNCPYPDKNRIFIKLCIFRTPDCRKCEICPRVTGCSRLLDAHRVLRPMV